VSSLPDERTHLPWGLLATMASILLIFCLSTACSSSSSSPVAAPNPCATKGATYTNTFKQTSGTNSCGMQMSQEVSVSESGQVTSSTYGIPITCGSSEVNGCISTNSDCTYSGGGMACSLFTDITFADGGASLTGTETLECGDCQSTYSIVGTRQ
jgi:hypothetical protein